MEALLRVMIVEDQAAEAELAERELGRSGIAFDPLRVETREAFVEALKRFRPEVILCDFALPAFNAMEALEIANRLAPWVPVLVVTGALDDAQAVSVLAAGADDYILKDRMARLGPAVQRAIENRRIRRENAAALQALRESEERYRRLFELESDAIVLVDNETGHVLEVNAAATTLYGYSRDEWLRMNHTDVSAEPERTRQAAVEGLTMIPLRWHRKRDGTVFPVEITASHFDWHGRPVHVAAIRDASERIRAEEELRSSRAQLLEAQRIARVGSWRFVPADGTFEWSEEMLRLLGIRPDGAAPTYEAYRRLIHPEDRTMFDASVRGCLVTGEAQEVEFRIVRPDGTIRHVIGRGERERGDGGDRVGFHGTIQDVTEQRKGRDLEATLHGIFEAARAASTLTELFAALHAIVGRFMPAPNFHFALLDPATGLVEFPYFVDETGAAPQPIRPGAGLTGRVLSTGEPLLLSGEALADVARRGDAVLSGGPSVQWLGVPLTVGGRVIGAMVLESYSDAATYTEQDRDLLSSLSVATAEAIERKRAEQALRESEARYRLLFNSSNDAVFVLRIAEDGSPGRFVEVNDVACLRLGYRREELLGMCPVDVHSEDTEMRVPEIMRRLRAEGRAVWEGTHVARDGRTIPVEISNHLFELDGRPAVLATVRDITERKRLEEQALLSRKMEVAGTIAGGVAHDVNNLLQAMLATVQSLRMRPPEPERLAAELAALEELIRRGARLPRQLLIFSRREISTREIVELNETVRAAGRMVRPLLPESIAFALDLDEGRSFLRADRGQIEQVVANLALNAAEAMPDGGALTVRTGRDGDRVWLEVEDTGPGIPAAIRDRIFEPFFTTKPAGRGTGLGLPVVLGIVTSHDGTIAVHGGAGKGARFRILLPAAGEEPAGSSQIAGDLGAGLPSGKGERVLIVEDEAGAREGLAEILAMLGYEVATAASAEETVARCAARPFDLLLTDMMLPGRSGIELASDLKARCPGLRVILMSGYTDEDLLRRRIRTSGARFLQKPFDMATLARAARAALDGEDAAAPPDGRER
ncbi:MAG: PAS domain S-box protein [Thermoanaerobaculaceae bacterium]|nr:PAS domain S-box protein [Thermoanaerobaculaceae bacterium]